MAFQKKKKMFKRRGENGEEITVYTGECWKCRTIFGSMEPDVWECPYCKDASKQKRWPNARVVSRRHEQS